MELTLKIAYAAGHDAGGRSMRKAGRTSWSEDDYDAACDEINRLWDFVNNRPRHDSHSRN